ncbi:P-loop NTPase [Erythrobacter sp. HL-111]|uniref:P-loop NTPase n=1 Tax=Erythrobacter sp. HL-111 TaxID=1798193 RepID=UPI0006DA244C|nr:P-loop NTPase [Erythrobacter sp. HL-111]KPP96582.1 MAG: ATPases involved in chromosome partitioning [Erythrobacteraceae bacterium HL-111]SDS03023.1 Chromosome partitioning ATPase, Mrp family, contains Fe-S cluster [Erythrobacter sp. HL-111]
MTEFSRITPPRDAQEKRRSLIERADDAFGLDRLGPARVPRALPEARRTPPQVQAGAPIEPPAAETAAAESAAAPSAGAGAPPSAPPVALSGPRQAVDRECLRREGLLVPEDPVTGQLEEFRIVKRELLTEARAGNDPLARRILVCSPHPGEGKTYCATNLAIALAAERDIEVVLIDADVVKPSVTRRLGIEGGPGLMDALADPAIAPESCVIRTDIEGLFVLPAGGSNVRDAEYLASARTGELLDRLTRDAPRRILVFDTPPALAASPAAELAGHVGQALLVVRADETSRAALEDARQLLSACPDIKLLLNAARYSPSGRRFGDYGKGED